MKNLIKRISALLMVAMLILGMSVTAFATEIDVPAESPIDEPQGEVWTAVASGESTRINVPLYPYIGIVRTFKASAVINTGAPTITGTMHFSLKNSSGTEIFSGNVSVGSSSEKDFTLPSSGTYYLDVTNNTNITITAKGQWY